MSTDMAVRLRVQWWKAKRWMEASQDEPLGFALWFIAVVGTAYCLGRMVSRG
jgi:hypothetical protein